MRILLISYSMPYRVTTGAEVCTQNYIDAMTQLGHQVDVVAYSRFGDRSVAPPPNVYSAGEWYVETAHAGALAYVWLARAFLTGSPYVTTKFRSRKMVRTIEQLTARNHYECTIIDHTHLGWLLDYEVLPRPWIFSAHNLECKLYADQAADKKRNGAMKRAILGRDARLLQRLETRFVAECKQTWVLTRSERKGFAALVSGSVERIHIFDLPGRPVSTGPQQREVNIDVGILGGWLWEVNRRGLEWFMTSVVPLLPPTFRIHIAGHGAGAVPNPHANVTYEGFVDSAVEFLRRCKVIVVPTVSGAGVQIKTIEGISAGVPMVSTPIGLRGMSDLPGFVSVAETPEQMATLIRDRVLSPIPPDFEAGARWASSRRAAFTHSVGQALATIRDA